MDRQIVICFDGTGNEIRERASNVLKIYRHLKKDGDQRVHYIPGVGTMDNQRLAGRWWQKAKSVAGLAFGLGLEDDVLDAYRYLSHTYRSAAAKEAADPSGRDWRDDRIYLIGFSRGAYAARVLAGFLHNFGLLPPDRLHMAAQVFRAYRRLMEDARPAAGQGEEAQRERAARHYGEMRLYGKVLEPDVTVHVRALGLFDTVSSMIRFEPDLKAGSIISFGRHPGTAFNTSVRIVRQALAVDERRAMFRAEPWVPSAFYPNRFRPEGLRRQQYVEQRWFPGYHGDIGGSNAESESGIGKLTALWMLDGIAADEAAADAEDARARSAEGKPPLPDRPHGLRLKQRARARYFEGATDDRTETGKPYAAPDPLAPVHSSMAGFWPVFEVIPKSLTRREWRPGRPGLIWYLPLAEPRLIPDGHVVDPGVHARIAAKPLYRPPNVPPASQAPP